MIAEEDRRSCVGDVFTMGRFGRSSCDRIGPEWGDSTRACSLKSSCLDKAQCCMPEVPLG